MISNERRIDARVISIRMLTSEETNLLTMLMRYAFLMENQVLFFFLSEEYACAGEK